LEACKTLGHQGAGAAGYGTDKPGLVLSRDQTRGGVGRFNDFADCSPLSELVGPSIA